MNGLTSQQALEAWERCEGLGPFERPHTLLAAALPDVDSTALPSLPLGGRDALLFRLRQRTLGPFLRGFARCPACDTRLEFDLDTRSFPIETSLDRKPREERYEHAGVAVRFRLPDSTDFAAMSQCGDVAEARAMLLERCVLTAEDGDGPIATQALPEPVIQHLSERMEALDPMADLPLAIECAACEHAWTVVLDIASVMWREVSDLALRLLDEVQQLARGFGWSESDILAMSVVRRRYYLTHLAPPDPP